MTKIGVIIGTAREGRVTDRLAKWVGVELEGKAEYEIIDLADYPLPFVNEASPRYNPERKAAPEVQRWLDKVAEFDGYVIVTPEYNRSIPGILKNALDSLDYQMEQKPVALVAHGSLGGAFSVATLRSSLPQIGVITVPNNVFFSDRVGEVVSEAGELNEELRANPWGPQASLQGMVTQLIWLTEAVNAAR
jgi:NAD(P)H-dependent FMN reductase